MKIEPGWWRMSPEYILEYVWFWKRPKRPHVESQNLIFDFFRPEFSKTFIFTIPP